MTRQLLFAMALALATSTLLAAGPSSQARPQPGDKTTARAHADIKGDNISGTLELTEVQAGTGRRVLVALQASGLKPGLHGVHLHAVGKCEPPFTSAGGHFDPGPASNTDPDANHPFHMGDLPNLRVGDDGKGTLNAVTTRVTLSDGPLTVFDADGTAVIVHANQDQEITGEPKSGVSGGPRIACGVIVKK
jgi:Cu-Zn family superoxide dismutase